MLLDLNDFFAEFEINYQVVSKKSQRYISSVGMGINDIKGDKTLPQTHLEIDLLKGHATILEILDIDNIKMPRLLPGVFLIISNKNEKEIIDKVICFAGRFPGCTVFFVKSDMSAQDIYFKLVESISKESAFMQDLLFKHYVNFFHLLTQNVEIGDIERMAYKILNNPMIITDESYKVIAYSHAIEINDPIWLTIVSNDYCPSEIVEMTNYNNFWQRLSRSELPLFVDSEDFSPYVRRAVAEIRSAGKIRGYIALLEINKTITINDLKLLQMVAQMVGVKLAEKDAVSKAIGQLENQFIGDLLSGAVKNEKMAVSRALSMGWRIKKWFSVFYIQARDKNAYIGSKLEFIKSKLSGYFPLCVYSFNGSGAFFIVSFNDRNWWNNLLSKEIEKFMTDEGLICSAGLPVDSLIAVEKSYNQAQKTSSIIHFLSGNISKRSVFKYSELAVYDMLLRLFQKEDATSMISPGLVRLKEFDRDNGTEYISTLRHFFENNQNSAATAESMYLHRNTINYRLNRIRELMEDDFDNPLVRLYLYISLILQDIINK
ncbi:PucR family transcriptional regulator [Thermoanaerobacteraceae bacterium SP2]|nr:PucR family transcriptional regulator [Thermoanaerobacteraceae bacterium SP2]